MISVNVMIVPETTRKLLATFQLPDSAKYFCILDYIFGGRKKNRTKEVSYVKVLLKEKNAL